MLIGLSLLISAHHVVPRGGVTILAQLTAGAFGPGGRSTSRTSPSPRYSAFAANTSFGGLPVLDEPAARTTGYRTSSICGPAARLPLRESSCSRSSRRRWADSGQGADLQADPLFTIGVFVGFTVKPDRSRPTLVHGAAEVAGDCAPC